MASPGSQPARWSAEAPAPPAAHASGAGASRRPLPIRHPPSAARWPPRARRPRAAAPPHWSTPHNAAAIPRMLPAHRQCNSSATRILPMWLPGLGADPKLLDVQELQKHPRNRVPASQGNVLRFCYISVPANVTSFGESQLMIQGERMKRMKST